MNSSRLEEAGTLRYCLRNLEEMMLIPVMAVLTILAFMQVVTRFILHVPLPWTEELMRFLFIWGSTLGASAGLKRAAHPNLELVTGILPESGKKVARLISIGCVVLFCILMDAASIPLVVMQRVSGQLSAAMRIPMYMGTLAIPVGFTLLGVRAVQIFFHTLQSQ